MTQTIVDEIDRTFLLLRDAAACDDGAGEGSAARWCVHVCDPASPLAGLYAFADTLAEARDAVAVLAWTAVLAGELVPFGYTADDLAWHPRRRHHEHRVRRRVADRSRRERRGVEAA